MKTRDLFTQFRTLFITLCSAAFVLTAGAVTHADEVITMYKQTYCGCCEKWADHLRRAGFEVNTVNMYNLAPLNDRLGIPVNVESCHTAKLGNYYIIGHVPVADIRKMLEEKRSVLGISVPGMPVGSRGMEIPGMIPDKYDSVLFSKNGETAIYVSH